MQAVQFSQPGEPTTVLRIVDAPRPEPRPGEVLVRMLASPVNPSDLMFIRGRYTIEASCPAVPGFEGVGVVEANGGGLRGRVMLGRRVVVPNARGGNWAEYAVLPADRVIPVSSKLTDEQAATFFVNPATAWVMTQEVLRLPRGAWLVQTAAGSALGRMIVRLGRHLGFRTFNIVRRESVVQELLALGADHVCVCNSDDDFSHLAGAIRSTIHASGATHVIDAVGGSLGSQLVHLLSPGGTMLAYGTLSDQPLSFSPRTLMTSGSRVEGFWLGRFMESQGLLFKLRLVQRLTRLIREGILATPVARAHGLKDVQQAVAGAQDSAVAGKVLLLAGSAGTG
jgi:NADPH:quinone reductase-like Zn-dependent oxidoreductase